MVVQGGLVLDIVCVGTKFLKAWSVVEVGVGGWWLVVKG